MDGQPKGDSPPQWMNIRRQVANLRKVGGKGAIGHGEVQGRVVSEPRLERLHGLAIRSIGEQPFQMGGNLPQGREMRQGGTGREGIATSQIPVVAAFDMRHFRLGCQHVHEKGEILAARQALAEGRTRRLCEIAPNQLVAQRAVQIAAQNRLPKRGGGGFRQLFGSADFRSAVRRNLDPPFPCQVGAAGLGGGEKSCIHARIYGVVGIGIDEVASGRRREQVLSSRGHAPSLVMAKNPRTRRKALFVEHIPQHLDGTVRRGVVAKEKLRVGDILRRERGDKAAQKARALAYRHKNRKRRLDRRHSTTFQLSR